MDVAFTVRSHSYSSPLLFVYSCMALRRDLIDVPNPDSSSNPYAPRFDLADATDADHSRVLPVSRTGDVGRGVRICRRHRVLRRAQPCSLPLFGVPRLQVRSPTPYFLLLSPVPPSCHAETRSISPGSGFVTWVG